MAGPGAPIGSKNAAGNKGKLFNDSLRRIIARHGKGEPIPLHAGIDKLAEKLVDAAMAGEQWALQEIANRLDGKPAQSVEVSGSEDNPLTVGVIRLVRPG